MAQRERLTGQALIEFMRQNAGEPEKEVAKNSGYWRQKKDGSIVHNIKAMYQEFARAQGAKMAGVREPSDRRRGPKGNVLKTAQSTGILPISPAYLRQIGVKPGDRVEVEVQAETETTKACLVVVLHQDVPVATPAPVAPPAPAPEPTPQPTPALTYV